MPPAGLWRRPVPRDSGLVRRRRRGRSRRRSSRPLSRREPGLGSCWVGNGGGEARASPAKMRATLALLTVSEVHRSFRCRRAQSGSDDRPGGEECFEDLDLGGWPYDHAGAGSQGSGVDGGGAGAGVMARSWRPPPHAVDQEEAIEVGDGRTAPVVMAGTQTHRTSPYPGGAVYLSPNRAAHWYAVIVEGGAPQARTVCGRLYPPQELRAARWEGRPERAPCPICRRELSHHVR